MNTIYDADKLITGDDFRFGFEYQLQYKGFGLQSEFIEAHINDDKAWGYYASMDYLFNEKFQATAGLEKYADFINTTNDNEWYGMV
ncbi:MAG: hypothetical protein U5K00_04685 [Melioribacteraceae bacterium]|nr:hypothetical protein [Melioribacteraceae bacterium]